MTKKYHFEAETGKILELLTHSIYSNKEIFLRELISNASDAIDKARIKALTDTKFLGDDSEFRITVESNNEAGTITITDNGIGMTKEELQSHLGTIAKSGTSEFLEKLKLAKEDGEHNLIGQFGVGFYSSFMVADKVVVESKSALDTKAYTWTSDGKTEYTIEESNKQTRGTKVTLFLDETNKELCTDWKIRELIKKYSNYLPVPIMMLESDYRNEEEKKKEPREAKFEQVNQTKPIWKKTKSEVKEDEIKEFYSSVSMDFQAPLTSIWASIEGMVSYKSLLFAPKEKNMLLDVTNPNKDYGPKLYIQNVLILENAKELLPVWLRFISGVVETTDLPLNISREMLQSNSTLEKIKKGLTKKVLSELKKTMTEDSINYDIFLKNFASILKEGIHYEADLKEQVAEVLKFQTLLGKNITLDEYIATQVVAESTEKYIYYITGKSETEVHMSPYLAQFKENNTDVILLTDPIDIWLVKALTQYKEIKLKSVTANDIQLKKETKEEIEKKEEVKKDYKNLLELMKNSLPADAIEKIAINEKIGHSIAAIKTPEGGIDPQMEKIMKAMGQTPQKQKRILEINTSTSLVQAMKKEFEREVTSEKLKDMMMYTYYTAVLLEGGEIENIAEFVDLTHKIAGTYL